MNKDMENKEYENDYEFVKRINNHVYFRTEIERDSIFELKLNINEAKDFLIEMKKR